MRGLSAADLADAHFLGEFLRSHLLSEDERIVHRDVKPANILLDDKGHPKLADLGLVKDVDSVQITATGLVMGTPAFMAPEQALGEKDLDTRTDLYALGCCLYQMLTGRVPFVKEGLNLIEIVRRRLGEDLEDVRVVRGEISGATAAIVRGWVDQSAANASDRYPNPGSSGARGFGEMTGPTRSSLHGAPGAPTTPSIGSMSSS